jgi:hypothetical protein
MSTQADAAKISRHEHPLARMLPFRHRQQLGVYRFGQKIPPHDPRLDDHGPVWEVFDFVLASQDNQNTTLAVQPDFTFIAIGASSTIAAPVNGGFRIQLFDVLKARRFATRGVQQGQIGGPMQAPGPFFLRDPYYFDLPNSQIKISIQNLETQQNKVQVVLYGMARPDWVYGNTLPPRT